MTNQDSTTPVLDLILRGQDEIMKAIARHMVLTLIRILTVYHIDRLPGKTVFNI